MLSIFAHAMKVATRQDRWSGYDHWRQETQRSWQIERRLAEERDKLHRRSGLL